MESSPSLLEENQKESRSKESVYHTLLALPKHRLFPIVILLLMAGAVIFLDAIAPLRGLWLDDVFMKTPLSPWLLIFTRHLFPGKATVSFVPHQHTDPGPLTLALSESILLFAAFVLLFALYLFAVYYLPSRITRRFIFLSTLFLGALFVAIPVMTSQDVFSYIGYARIGVFYHLNPLTTTPAAIPNDPINPHIYWQKQPSAYGPTWIAITALFQWIALMLGLKQVAVMVLILRLFSLTVHLSSTLMIWSISGKLQRFLPSSVSNPERLRLRATLAFAWNPLLLLEACVNAHNDTVILFLVLCMVWFLVPGEQGETLRSFVLAAVMLALATCLKVTFFLLAPLVLIFLWKRPSRRWVTVLLPAGAYIAMILLLYAPFWQGVQTLHVFKVNPATLHENNSFQEVFVYLYAGRHKMLLPPSTATYAPPLENITHMISSVLFLIIYAGICLRALLSSRTMTTVVSLVRWMALTWLCYCVVGSPWYWPWYMITFLGLFALLEAYGDTLQPLFGIWNLTVAVCLLSLAMVAFYCGETASLRFLYLPYLTHVTPSNLTGLFWLLPLLAIDPRVLLSWWRKLRNQPSSPRTHHDSVSQEMRA